MRSYEHWETIVDQIKNHDQQGMIDLYAVLKKGTRGFISRQLDVIDVDDYVHDLFILVVEHIREGRLRDPQRLIGYATSIAKNMVAGHIRAVQRTREKFANVMDVEIQDQERTADSSTIAREDREILDYAYSSVGDAYKQIVQRVFVLDQPKAQVKADLNLTEKQFTLAKSRAAARVVELGKRKLEGLDPETTTRKAMAAAA